MIWPPSNPISTRTRSSAIADHFRKDAVDRIRVDERDLEPEQASARPFVDQLRPLGDEVVERLADIVDLVRDMVHSRPAVSQKPPNGRVFSERREQLHAIGADPQRRRLDALVGDRFPVLEPRPEEPLVGREGLVEVVDRHADVVNALRLHPADAIRSLRV